MDAPTTPHHPERLIVVDALRGVAALMVLLSHLPEVSGLLLVLRPLQALGHTGVSLFLVLSGFSIHYRYAQRKAAATFDAEVFWRRRAWRLYPTYGAAVVATVMIVAAAGPWPAGISWPFSAEDEPWVILVLAQVTLVGANIVAVPFVGIAWSLALEVQLYAAYAVVIKHLRRIGVWRVVGFAFALAMAWRLAAQYVTPSVPVGQFLQDGSSTTKSQVLFAQLPARWFEWMLGVAVAELRWSRVGRSKSKAGASIAIVALVASGVVYRSPLGELRLNGNSYFASDIVLDPLFGVGYAALLVAAVGMSSASVVRLAVAIRPLAIVGMFSYSLYLFHPALLQLGTRIVPAQAPNIVREAVLTIVALAGAFLLFWLVERHFLSSRPPARSVAVAGSAEAGPPVIVPEPDPDR